MKQNSNSKFKMKNNPSFWVMVSYTAIALLAFSMAALFVSP